MLEKVTIREKTTGEQSFSLDAENAKSRFGKLKVDAKSPLGVRNA
jgi:hypothetical protein